MPPFYTSCHVETTQINKKIENALLSNMAKKSLFFIRTVRNFCILNALYLSVEYTSIFFYSCPIITASSATCIQTLRRSFKIHIIRTLLLYFDMFWFILNLVYIRPFHKALNTLWLFEGLWESCILLKWTQYFLASFFRCFLTLSSPNT